MPDETYTLILFPEFLAAKKDVEKLQTELSMLLLERDELRYIQCKNIEMAYMLSLGDIEYKAYELHCAVLRLKRKLELVQAKRNRQESIDLSVIDAKLDEEFTEYKKNLDAQIKKMNDAIARNKAETLSDADTKELKKLYRSIVKVLHPDLHPDATDAQVQLFQNAVRAYEAGDLYTLRLIGTMVAEPVVPDETENSLTVLLKEKARLTEVLARIRKEIEQIKADYPYNMKSLVEDPDRVEAKRLEFEQLIYDLTEVYESYTARLNALLRQA